VGGKTLLGFPSNIMMVMWFKELFVWVFVVSYLCWLLELSTGYISIVISVPVHFVKPQDNGWGLIMLISDICGHTVM
jgi:hypothetical protein